MSDWRGVASNAYRRVGPRGLVEGALAGLGAALAIGGMEWFSWVAHYPLVFIPFATSIVLVIDRKSVV